MTAENPTLEELDKENHDLAVRVHDLCDEIDLKRSEIKHLTNERDHARQRLQCADLINESYVKQIAELRAEVVRRSDRALLWLESTVALTKLIESYDKEHNNV